MDRIFALLAPSSRRGAMPRWLALMGLIHGLNWVVTTQLRGIPYAWDNDFLSTTLIAGPVVALVVAVLLHARGLHLRLEALATTDMLTGLPNRRAFLEAMEAALPRGGALLILDADHFKRINDTHGHAVGDACLEAIAERLRTLLGPRALLGRLGGEEFAAFLPAQGRRDAMAEGARLCRPLAVAVAGGGALWVTLSAGVTAAPAGAATPDRAVAVLNRLMAEADAALYRAKAEGRARAVLWTPPQGEGGRRAA